MTTMTNRRVDVRAGEKREKIFAQTNSRAGAPERRMGRQLITRHSHQEWKRQLDEAWQGHLDTLRQYMSVLLLKNQPQNIALKSVDEPGRRYRNAITL